MIDMSTFGLQRALRRSRQVFSRAIVLSTGHRMREWARLTHLRLTVRPLPGRRRWVTAAMPPAPW